MDCIKTLKFLFCWIINLGNSWLLMNILLYKNVKNCNSVINCFKAIYIPWINPHFRSVHPLTTVTGFWHGFPSRSSLFFSAKLQPKTKHSRATFATSDLRPPLKPLLSSPTLHSPPSLANDSLNNALQQGVKGCRCCRCLCRCVHIHELRVKLPFWRRPLAVFTQPKKPKAKRASAHVSLSTNMNMNMNQAINQGSLCVSQPLDMHIEGRQGLSLITKRMRSWTMVGRREHSSAWLRGCHQSLNSRFSRAGRTL